MRIAFIMAGVLPMPPVKGGAVENLVDFFLKENEKEKKYEIDVYSCEKNHNIKHTEKYNCTKFITLNAEDSDKFVSKIRRKIRRKTKLIEIPFENYIKNISRMVKKNKYDVIIIENRPMYVPIIRKIYSGTLILHIHNDTFNKNTKGAKKIISDVDYVFAISDYIKNRAAEIDKNQKQKIKILNNGIEVEKFHMSIEEKQKNKNQMLEKYGINIEDRIIIYSGRLIKEKGVLELVKAFNKVEKSFDNIKLLIVGSPVYGEMIKENYLVELEKEIAMNSSKVIFTGYVDYWEINKFYNIAYIGIVPSICQEAAGMTALEIQASGLPIIATNIGGLSEMVGNAGVKIELNNEFVDNLADAMITLLNNEKFYKNCAQKSFENAQKYSVENYYLNLNRLINSVKTGDN